MRLTRLVGLLQGILQSRRLPIVLGVTALVISLGALGTGWDPSDDSRHRVKLLDPSSLPPRLLETGLVPDHSAQLGTVTRYLHTFAHTLEDIHKLKAYGVAPWWTSPDFRFSNWRPLDGFTHWLDYRFYPNAPVLIHAHSLLWFAAGVGLMTLLYRRLMAPAWVPSLAALLYLLDSSNYVYARWIANRNLGIAVVFGVAALWAHHRWRQSNSRRAALAAPVLLFATLLATEAGIAVVAYLFAYALFLDRGRWLRRMSTLWPAALIVVSWRALYNLLGHGTYGSSVIDPVHEPVHYLAAVVTRAPLLLLSQWGFPPADVGLAVSRSVRADLWIAGVLYVLAGLLLLIPLLRGDRRARFWFTGMALALLPICATMPMDRNLPFVAIGAFAVEALFLGGLWCKADWCPSSRWWRVPAGIFAVVLLLVHVGGALWLRAKSEKAFTNTTNLIVSTMEAGVPRDIADQTLVAVNAPLTLVFLPLHRGLQGEVLPRAIRVLTPALTGLEASRLDERTLRLRSHSDSLFACEQKAGYHIGYFFEMFNSFITGRGPQFAPAHREIVPGMTVDISAVDADGLPREILVRFATSLDDPALCWITWNWQQRRYDAFHLPAVGAHLEVKGPFDVDLVSPGAG
jgi:hypothetical protein